MTAHELPASVPWLALRPAGPGDLGFLELLHASGREEEVSTFGWAPSTARAFLHQQFEAREAHRAGLYPGSEQSIVQVDGEDAGRLVVCRATSAIRIVELSLRPASRGRGVGTAVTQGLQREAAAVGARLVLDVPETNPAVRLCERLGFRLVGRGGIDLAMEWRPPSSPPRRSWGT